MDDFEALPDARLAANVQYFFDYRRAVAGHVAVGNVLVFNLGDQPLEVDGRIRTEPALFCICNDPAVLPFARPAEAIVGIRFAYGAFYRLFGLDAARNRGVISVDAGRHPAMAAIGNALRDAGPSPAEHFAALERALLELQERARPPGLAERFFSLVIARNGDMAIAEAVEELGCSARTLERDCRRRFGRTPKRLARGWRAAWTWKLERERGERPETMPEFSFADLSHYARELRTISGLSRTEHRAGEAAVEALEIGLVWPDGRQVSSDDERDAWHAELDRRISAL